MRTPHHAEAASAMVDILVADSVTHLDSRHRGQVVMGGSHGGVYAGYLAAKAGVRAVVLSDAGVGKDRAGIGALAYLDKLGMAAATVGHMSARIGDGADFLARGVISHVNRTAAGVGCAPGQSCRDCAQALHAAPDWHATPPAYEEGRVRLRTGAPEVWGLDSASLIAPGDEDRILVTGSHGALPGGKPEAALGVRPRAAVFNDAGVGIDEIGIGRLAALDAMGVPAATVAAMSARIGDARSTWQDGRISYVNELAAALGARAGLSTPAFADLVARGR
jgi:hypothetical protein